MLAITRPTRPRPQPRQHCLAARTRARPQSQTMSVPADRLLLMDRRVAALPNTRPDLAAAGLDVELLSAVASQSVAPLLRTYAERLGPVVEQVSDGTVRGAAWTRGHCPICGGWPLIGELRGVELAEWLRCAACAHGWRGQRLMCPYCGNNDYRSLATLTIESEQRFRISVCELCKGFLKVANAFDPAPAELLALDDVASLHLDLAAIERGYQRPPGSGYRIELAMPELEWVEGLA